MSQPIEYTVKQGNTLAFCAQVLGVTLSQFKKINADLIHNSNGIPVLYAGDTVTNEMLLSSRGTKRSNYNKVETPRSEYVAFTSPPYYGNKPYYDFMLSTRLQNDSDRVLFDYVLNCNIDFLDEVILRTPNASHKRKLSTFVPYKPRLQLPEQPDSSFVAAEQSPYYYEVLGEKSAALSQVIFLRDAQFEYLRRTKIAGPIMPYYDDTNDQFSFTNKNPNVTADLSWVKAMLSLARYHHLTKNHDANIIISSFLEYVFRTHSVTDQLVPTQIAADGSVVWQSFDKNPKVCAYLLEICCELSPKFNTEAHELAKQVFMHVGFWQAKLRDDPSANTLPFQETLKTFQSALFAYRRTFAPNEDSNLLEYVSSLNL